MTNKVKVGGKAIYTGEGYSAGSYSPLITGMEVKILAEDLQYPEEDNPTRVFICSWHNPQGFLQVSPIIPSKLEAVPDYTDDVKQAAQLYADLSDTEVNYRAMKATLDIIREEGYFEKRYEVTFLTDGGFSFLEDVEFPKTVKLKESEVVLLGKGIQVNAGLLATVLDVDVSDFSTEYLEEMKYFIYTDEVIVKEVK